MTDYCTVAEIKADNPEGGFANSSAYDTALGGFITDASRAIDREMGRWDDFFCPSGAETRYFDGNGSSELWINEFLSVSSLAVSEEGGLASSDYTTWAASDYILWPYNSLPYMAIIVDRRNGSKLYFDAYPKSVKITGVFGYSISPPRNVRRACSIQAVRWFQRAKQNWAETGAKADLGQVIVNVNQKDFIGSKLDPDVAALLQPIKIGLQGA